MPHLKIACAQTPAASKDPVTRLAAKQDQGHALRPGPHALSKRTLEQSSSVLTPKSCGITGIEREQATDGVKNQAPEQAKGGDINCCSALEESDDLIEGTSSMQPELKPMSAGCLGAQARQMQQASGACASSASARSSMSGSSACKGSCQATDEHKSQDRAVYCCLPSGCPRPGDTIHLDTNKMRGDMPVKVICNSDVCTAGEWMHADCFQQWEEQVLAYLRTCGRARSWSAKQRVQNLWTKKGYDLAYKACACSCGRGHLRKDLDHATATTYTASGSSVNKPDDASGKKPRKRFATICVVGSGATGVAQGSGRLSSGRCNSISGAGGGSGEGSHHRNTESCEGGCKGGPEFRTPLRVRTTSLCSTSSSPSSSDGISPLTPGGGKLTLSLPPTPGVGSGAGHKFDFFTNPVHAAAGNIFNQRKDMDVFKCLPRPKRNTYQIKVEDEGQHGNDETRTFLMINLSALRVTHMMCIVCQDPLLIYDKYPIIDGLLYLSPIPYHEADQQPICISHSSRGGGNRSNMARRDSTNSFLHAICVHCLSGVEAPLHCISCHSAWPGATFVIGTMYAYDVFAAMPCCALRLRCKSCGGAVLDVSSRTMKSFSDYSQKIECPQCHVTDFHFVKQLGDLYRFTGIPPSMTRQAR